MLTAVKLMAAVPASKPYAHGLVAGMIGRDIMDTEHRAAGFLGQIHVESGGFENVVENLNYSATALKKLFGRHRISLADADKFGRTSQHPAHQNALANILYGGSWGAAHLGNTEPGDGWRFRGRGLKQLTGRSNYKRFSRWWLGEDTLLTDPDRVAAPDGAVASALWFWTANGLNALADTGTVEDVTLKVNGGLNGLPQRVRWTDFYRNLWHA